MSGVRRMQEVSCSHCGTKGIVRLGMAMVNHVDDRKDFSCASCGKTLSVRAPRAILDLQWQPVMDEDGSATAALR